METDTSSLSLTEKKLLWKKDKRKLAIAKKKMSKKKKKYHRKRLEQLNKEPPKEKPRTFIIKQK